MRTPARRRWGLAWRRPYFSAVTPARPRATMDRQPTARQHRFSPIAVPWTSSSGGSGVTGCMSRYRHRPPAGLPGGLDNGKRRRQPSTRHLRRQPWRRTAAGRHQQCFTTPLRIDRARHYRPASGSARPIFVMPQRPAPQRRTDAFLDLRDGAAPGMAAMSAHPRDLRVSQGSLHHDAGAPLSFCVRQFTATPRPNLNEGWRDRAILDMTEAGNQTAPARKRAWNSSGCMAPDQASRAVAVKAEPDQAGNAASSKHLRRVGLYAGLQPLDGWSRQR